MEKNLSSNLFINVSDAEASAINGGGLWDKVLWWGFKYSFRQLLDYHKRTDPYRDSSGRIMTSRDPYDR